jgi:ankyrin repeat protein
VLGLSARGVCREGCGDGCGDGGDAKNPLNAPGPFTQGLYAKRNNIEAMRAILRNGVAVNPISLWSFETPLHLAVQGNIDTVKLLVEHGAVVKIGGDRLAKPLHLAVQAGKIDVVRLLLEVWPEGTRIHSVKVISNTISVELPWWVHAGVLYLMS